MERTESGRAAMRAAVAATLIAAAGLPVSAVLGQEAAPATTGGQSPPAAPAETRIRFNFDGVAFDQVLDFFARETNLPVVREAPVPDGTLKFISARDFALGEAIEVFNFSLRTRGVRLVHEGDFLYLRTIEGAATDARPVSPDELKNTSDRDASEYVTTYIPLNNATADTVVEQIKPLIRPPGMVQAIARQNMLILVETASQCKRIYEIISQVDMVRPADITMKVIPLRYTQAEQIVATLKGLIPELDQIMVKDKNDNARLIDDVSKPPMKIQADTRINAVVAVGPTGRMPLVDELTSMLDSPTGGGAAVNEGPQLRAFEVVGVTPTKAAEQVNALFRALPEARRPNVQGLENVSRVMVVGTPDQLVQAKALLEVIDPVAAGEMRVDRAARVIGIEHLSPDQAMAIAQRLLTPRQSHSLNMAAAPSGRGLIVAGPSSDVDALEQLVRGIDVKADLRQEVRVVTLTSGNIEQVITKARELDNLTEEAAKDPVRSIVDSAARTVTLVGSSAGLARFEQRLRSAEQSIVVERESRTYTVTNVKASELVSRLSSVLRPMLEPDDGTAYVAPTMEAIDELSRLIVRARPEQFSTIEGLVQQFDQVRPGERQMQVMSLLGPDPEKLIGRAMELYRAQTAGMNDAEAGPIEYEIDGVAGKLIVKGRAEALRLFGAALQQAQQLMPPERTTRLIEVENGNAIDLVAPLMEFLASADSIDPSRQVPPAGVVAVERTNSLMVTAEEAQHQLIADYVRRLDRIEQSNLPPLKLLQLRTADAANIAGMLTQQYAQRAPSDRVARPVDIRADVATNTLIVAAHEELFDDIKSFVDDLNTERSDEPERITFLFPLKVAKAVDVAVAMDKLYPQPPMPADRLGRPMPWLQEPKEVTVSADPSSNSLIIDAPADREKSLRELAEKLDRVEVPPVAELRTYHVVNADLNSVARMLQGLSQNGSLSSPASTGRPKVPVVIETEPRSSTLIVAGDEVTFEKVEQVLKSLTAVPVERGLRIVPIANADAGEVRDRALAIYGSQIAAIPDAQPVDVTIDRASNSLEVVADVEAMTRFMRILDELQRQIGPAREVRMIELRLAQVGEVIGFLREMVSASESLKVSGGPEPVFEPIETTNSLLIAAQPAQFAVIEQLVRSLDNQQVAERPPLRIMKLRSTDAANLANVLERSYSQRPAEERAKKPADIQADAATNTLIVSAHDDVMAEIQSIVRELNESTSFDEADRQIRIFPLKIARAEELARTIDEMYPEPPMPRDQRGNPRPDLQRPKEIFVRGDRATNSLIVDAPTERLAGFEQIVASLDKAKLTENVELRTYRVERADLAAVQATLKQLADSGALSSNVQSPITINAEPASRTLVVSGPVEMFDRVEAVLKDVDAKYALPATTLRMYPLRHARAERIKTVIEQMLSARLREQRREQGLAVEPEDLLEVASDASSNTLIISAPEALQEAARQLIEVLDTEAAALGRSTVRVIPLTYAEANQVAATLNQALPTMDLPSGEKVSILPAASSNALLLAGADADLKKVESLIEPLDRQPFDPEKPDVRTFPLEHADAATIAKTVERLLVDQQQTDPRILMLQMRARNYQYAETPKIRVEAEPRTNSLIVSGPTATLELAGAMIERLDQPAEDPGRKTVTFTPAHADAAQLAATVSKLMQSVLPQGRRPMEIVAEPTSGTVLVIGQAEEVAQAVAQLAEIDERAPALPMVDVKSFELSHADAAGVATAARSLLGDQSRWPMSLVRAQKAGVRVPAVSVEPDARTNRLLVSAPSALMPLAEQLIGTLDRPRQNGTIEVQVFRLEKGKADSVATALQQALAAGLEPGEKPATVTAELASNSLVVAASSERLARAGELIKSMDEAVEPAGVGVRTVYLEHAQAEAIAPLVQRIIQRDDPLAGADAWSRSFLMRDMLRSGLKIEDAPVKVVAEPRLNALVISAPASVLELAEQVVRGLDVDRGPGGPGSDRVVRVITLTNADVSALSSNIGELFTSDQSGQVPPTVKVDAQSNSLIVRGTSEQIASIEGLVRQLDAATLSSSRQMRLITVDRSRADAQLMARTIQRLLEQQGGVKVEVISAEELMNRREKEGGQSGDARPFRPIFHGLRAWVIGHAVAAQPAGESSPEGEEASIVIAIDPATNSLLVVGSPRLTDRVAVLVSELEKQMPAEPTGVRIVTLPSTADARNVADIVAQTVREVGRSSTTNPGGFTGNVSVRPDPVGNAVIVWANETDFDAVSQLITGVSSLASTIEVTVKVYPLQNVSARQAVASLQDLLSPSPRGRQAQQLFDMTLRGPDGRPVRARVDPGRTSLVADPSDSALIVAGTDETIALVDRFIGMLDLSPVSNRMAIRQYPLRSAQAGELAQTFQSLFDAQRTGAGRQAQAMPQARFVPDQRTNSILVTGTSEQHAEVVRLLAEADMKLDDASVELAIIPLRNASPTAVRRIVEQVVVGRDPAQRERIQISAEDTSRLFVVKAPKEDMEQIRGIVAQVDEVEVGSFPIRSIRLKTANSLEVAQQLQQFFRERGNISGRRGPQSGGAAIVGDERSGTIVVSASDHDFEQIASMVEMFDVPAESQQVQYRIVELKNARVTDIRSTVENLAWELQNERMGGWWGGGNRRSSAATGTLLVEANERTNSLLVFGQGETVDTMLEIIAQLDRPLAEQTRLEVRAIRAKGSDLAATAQMIERATATPGWRSWQGRDPDLVNVEVDRERGILILIGDKARVDLAEGYVRQIAEAGVEAGRSVRSVKLQHADANNAAASLSRFFTDRARAQGLRESGVSVIGSREGNLLLISGDETELAMLDELVAQIDQPELGGDRVIEMIGVKHIDPAEAVRTVQQMFPSRRGDEQVIVSAQPNQSSVLVSARAEDVQKIRTLLGQIDTLPSAETAKIVTVPLKSARAADIASTLRDALPDGVRVQITPMARTNSVMLTGSEEAIALVREQIAGLDVETAQSPVEFRRIEIKHQSVSDVAFTVRAMMRGRPRTPGTPEANFDPVYDTNVLAVTASADEMPFIEQIIREIDTPKASNRRTQFVKLVYAPAESTAEALKVFYGRLAPEAATPAQRDVTIVPDPATNSLVISADESVWGGVESLLRQLDTEEYDTSQQLVVIPLRHADARSVAQALNEGLRAPLEDQLRREQMRLREENRGRSPNNDFYEPTVLVSTEGTPTVSAEVQTNSLIVFAGRKELERIEAIVKQLDVPDFMRLPQPRVIPITSGRASVIAGAIRQAFATQGSRAGSPREVVVIGDDTSGTLIVRADDEQFEQILSLATTLTEQVAGTQASPRVLRLKHVPAVRMRETLVTTFTPLAQQRNEALAIAVDRNSNALIISSSDELHQQIAALAGELDTGPMGSQPEAAPGSMSTLGQTVLIVDVSNHAPADMVRMLDVFGVTRAQPADRAGLVSEPVTLVPLTSRRGLAIMGSQPDVLVVAELISRLDTPPIASARQDMVVVPLRLGDATSVVASINAMLDTARQAPGSPAVAALREHIRRLNLLRDGFDDKPIELDLNTPIRVIADTATNSVMIGSSQANVAAIREIISLFDRLPVGEALVVRIFPLENSSAQSLRPIIEELFRESERLRTQPGTRRVGMPNTAVGQALAGAIAVSVDERTNALVVAGREEALALVEVLIRQLDGDDAERGWIEAHVVPLKYADAVLLARKIDEVLVRGLGDTPDEVGLQRQVGRLRLVLGDGAESKAVDSDVFAPMAGLVVTPEENLNALIVVGTPTNVKVVQELVKTLDVELASAQNAVQVIPLQHAAADRVSSILTQIFRQREALPTFRPEDRVVISVDSRTNALVVSTSPRSFELLRGLLNTLDTEETRFAVGLHVVQVPNADVRDLAPKLQRLMRERIQATRRSGDLQSPEDVFSIEPVPSTNSLIVAASDENLALLREFIESLTSGGRAISDAERMELIPIESPGRASEIAQAVNSLYVQKENERRGDRSVTLIANDRLNALIATGTASDIAAIRGFVARLDQARVETVQEFKRIALDSASATDVVRLLQDALAGRTIGGRGTSTQATLLRVYAPEIEEAIAEATIDGDIRDYIKLTADTRTNSVLVLAPPEMMRLILRVIQDLDLDRRGDRVIEAFQLVNADAQAMAVLLGELFNLRQMGDSLVLIPTRGEEQEDQQQGRFTPVPDPRQELSITVDRRTNTLLVSGTQEYLREVREVVTQLDQIQALEREQRVVNLRNAQAKAIETTLQNYFEREAERRRLTLGPQRAESFIRQLEQEVTVIGDEKSNKLVISASPRYMDTVAKIVQELDASPPQVMIQVLLAEVTLDEAESWGVDINIGGVVAKSKIGGDGYVFESLAGGAGVATSLGVPNFSVASTDFTLLLRALEEQGRLEVLSRPHVIVNNNEEASINVGENIAIVTGVDRDQFGGSNANVERRDVGIILNVRPSISSDGFVRVAIAPEISQLSQRSVEIDENFSAPIITQRLVDTTVTVKDGQTVVIGGLIQTIDEYRKTKAKGLGDLPLLGALFRTKDQSKVKTELLVILTPYVIPGETPQAELRQRALSERHLLEMTDPKPIFDALGHPGGLPSVDGKDGPVRLPEKAPMIDDAWLREPREEDDQK
ncbi:MAG: hypothetical protein KJZ65_14255 [Phycisphaerales bacterium]|nr:hypothetical protein [Phycisphaerales bacterium]